MMDPQIGVFGFKFVFESPKETKLEHQTDLFSSQRYI